MLLSGEPPVLVLSLPEGLLELHLGVGPLIELLARGGREVTPHAAQQLDHGGDGSAASREAAPEECLKKRAQIRDISSTV